MMHVRIMTRERVDAETGQGVAVRRYPDAGTTLHPDVHPPSVRFSGARLHARGDWNARLPVSGLRNVHVDDLQRWLQTRYHRYLFETVPEVFAARMRTAVQRSQRKAKPEPVVPAIHHHGRKLVPAAYLAGAGLLLGSSFWAISYGSMDPLPSVLMPWAGFHWSKLFFWRRVIS